MEEYILNWSIRKDVKGSLWVSENGDPEVEYLPKQAGGNFLTNDTTDWKSERGHGAIACHTRVIGGVLCRWWGEEEPRGVRILDRAEYHDGYPDPERNG